MVVVETGDRGTRWARFLGRRWYFIDPPQHLVYFSAASLEWTLRAAGFSGPVHVTRPGRRVSMANLVFKVLRGRAASLPRMPGSVYWDFGDGLMVASQRQTDASF